MKDAFLESLAWLGAVYGLSIAGIGYTTSIDKCLIAKVVEYSSAQIPILRAELENSLDMDYGNDPSLGVDSSLGARLGGYNPSTDTIIITFRRVGDTWTCKLDTETLDNVLAHELGHWWHDKYFETIGIDMEAEVDENLQVMEGIAEYIRRDILGYSLSMEDIYDQYYELVFRDIKKFGLEGATNYLFGK